GHLLTCRESLHARRELRFVEEAVEEQPPAEVHHRIGERDHLPVDDRGDAVVRPEELVVDAGVTPAERDLGIVLGRVRADPVERGDADVGRRAPALGPLERRLVVPEWLLEAELAVLRLAWPDVAAAGAGGAAEPRR